MSSTLTPQALSAAVQASFTMTDARQQALLRSLVATLHRWVASERLSHDEWRAALAFLTASAAITTPARNEFVLLSDVLGVSSLVDLLSHDAGATAGSVLGPFHNTDSLPLPNGADLVGDNLGAALVVCGEVRSTRGETLQGVEIDLWQANATGLYPEQDPTQHPHNLRGRLQVGDDGRYAFRTVRPAPYSVPYDGPVGALLRAAGRHAMRAAHVHLIASAAGHKSLVTELFFEGGEHLRDDAVFGVRDSLIGRTERCTDPALALPCRVDAPFDLMRFDIRLAPAHAA